MGPPAASSTPPASRLTPVLLYCAVSLSWGGWASNPAVTTTPVLSVLTSVAEQCPPARKLMRHYLFPSTIATPTAVTTPSKDEAAPEDDG